MSRRRSYRGRNYKFTEKTHSGRAVISLILSVFSIVSCCTMIGISFQNRGKAGLAVGSAGVFAFLLEIIALIIAISSFRDPDKFRLIPSIAIGVSVVSLIIWLALYLGGI